MIEALKKSQIPFEQVWFHGARARGDNKKSANWEYLVVINNWKGQLERIEDDVAAMKPFKDAEVRAISLDSMDRIGSVGWWAKEEGKRVDKQETHPLSGGA